MPRKRGPSKVARQRRLARQHRTLVYFDDDTNDGKPWGYWCQDCPVNRTYTTQKTAERSSDFHRARSRQPVPEPSNN